MPDVLQSVLAALRDPSSWSVYGPILLSIILGVLSTVLYNIAAAISRVSIETSSKLLVVLIKSARAFIGRSAEQRKRLLDAVCENPHFALLATAQALISALVFFAAAAVLLFLANLIPANSGPDWLNFLFDVYLIAVIAFLSALAYQFVKQVLILSQAYSLVKVKAIAPPATTEQR